ncbi:MULTISPECIES: hypothetical protein [Brucella/Ochrobactrum group]|uniref:Uncharacterized protein n=2 Tax=Ochrobactrum TaxID=528 RepID=A0ABD5JR98_9HYPH|nr:MULTISPECIES: hypothetical protein [Brucella]MCI0999067.1 hypothetical protein [Ochrobactrum sp. C6C9]WHT43888.1 hypothetical protein QLQ11_12950 [Ochrobactrum sp. SSR]MDX4075108.1 hypothetical protein [Brucella sp. NBRC 113783]WHS33789.1 hypothetical protein QLQ09_20875 [Brucella sp. NM4]SPL63769.1 hypothetical protein OHAE_3701 [[Ochrobactrum] soli]
MTALFLGGPDFLENGFRSRCAKDYLFIASILTTSGFPHLGRWQDNIAVEAAIDE